MGKSQRRKGADGERELRRLLVEQLGDDVVGHRNLFQYQEAGKSDLIVGAFDVEVKRRERFRRGDIRRFWAEACEQCSEGKMPALAFRGNGDEWRIVITMKGYTSDVWPDYDWTDTVGLLGFSWIVREAMEMFTECNWGDISDG